MILQRLKKTICFRGEKRRDNFWRVRKNASRYAAGDRLIYLHVCVLSFEVNDIVYMAHL